MNYYEKVSSIPVYMEEHCLPRQILRVKYRTGIGYLKTICGQLLKHTNSALGICMVIRTTDRDFDDMFLDTNIPVKWIKSMERLVIVDPDYDIGI